MKNLESIQQKLNAPKNQFNAFGKYKYRSCEDILEALKPLLKEFDCTVILSDEIKEAGGIVYVEAKASLMNENGKVVEVTAQAGINPNKKGMDISQSFGSSSSYARKYALNGLFLIDDTKDADTTNNHKEEQKPTPIKKVELVLNSEQWDSALNYLKKGGDLKDIEKKYSISDSNRTELMNNAI
jgi:hypothetical protein